MQRIKVAQRQIKSWMSDVRDFRGVQPNEVTALAKAREALALLQEVELHMALSDPLEIRPKSFKAGSIPDLHNRK